ncbi:hypothetical protein V1504DRAFT_472194 [Lipomyces starkeyi]
METRGNRQDYLALNDGYDTETQTDSRCSSPILDATDSGSSSLPYSIGQPELYAEVDPTIQLSDSEILPSESVSQPQNLTQLLRGHQLVRRAEKNHGFGNILPVQKLAASGLTTASKRGNLWIESSDV